MSEPLPPPTPHSSRGTDAVTTYGRGRAQRRRGLTGGLIGVIVAVVVAVVVASTVAARNDDDATGTSSPPSGEPSASAITRPPSTAMPTTRAPDITIPPRTTVITTESTDDGLNPLGGNDPEDKLMPDVVCMSLQDAQDEIQDHGVFFSKSVDATGDGRRQLWDRNWIVVSQEPVAGEPIGEREAVLSVVKKDEPNDC